MPTNPTYITRAYNFGTRGAWTPFIEDMGLAAERRMIAPKDALVLLDAYIEGKRKGADARQHTLTPPRMKRKMLHAVEDAIELAYRVK